MKKLLTSLLVLVVVLSLVACGQPTKPPTTAAPAPAPATTAAPAPKPTTAPAPAPSPAAPGKTYELKFGIFTPATHHLTKNVAEPWKKLVEELSGGRIQVKIFPGGLLGKTSEAFDYLKKGMADVDLTIPNFITGVFPLSDVMTLPFGIQSAHAGTVVYQRLYDKYLAPEYKDVHVLALAQSTGYMLISKKPVVKPGDAKGLIIKTSGGLQTDVVQSWGASDVGIAVAESYEALQRGTIDGVMHTYATFQSYKLQELASNLTEIGLAGSTLLWGMNKDYYEKLPRDLQMVVDYAGTFMDTWTAESYYNGDVEAREAFLKKGLKIYTPAGAEMDAFATPAMFLWQKWAKDMDAKGKPGTKVLEQFKYELLKFGIKR